MSAPEMQAFRIDFGGDPEACAVQLSDFISYAIKCAQKGQESQRNRDLFAAVITSRMIGIAAATIGPAALQKMASEMAHRQPEWEAFHRTGNAPGTTTPQ